MSTIPVDPAARALIFDLDGTLADTMPLHWQALRETFTAHGHECPAGWLEARNGIATVDLVPMFNREFGLTLDPAAFTAAKERRAVLKLAQARPNEPVVAIVHRFRGRLPLAIATSANRPNTETVLAAIDLSGAFDAIVTREDVLRQKPAPDIYLLAARRLAIEPHCCQAFEDSGHGLTAARLAGLMVVDVTPYLAQGRAGHDRLA